MGLYINHAFITCSEGAPEAEALLERGFLEGSRNVHEGQGTANRRFYFANFMLELFWVADPSVAASEAVRATGLWDRWSRRGDRISRFGVVFAGSAAQHEPVPFRTRSYTPPYLTAGMRFEVAQGLHLEEPAIYWVPTPHSSRPTTTGEPLD